MAAATLSAADPSSKSKKGVASEHRQAGGLSKRALYRSTCLVMGIFYTYSAYVQLNDPDAALWVAIYGSTALCSFVEALALLPKSAGGAPAWLPLTMAAFGLWTSLWPELSSLHLSLSVQQHLAQVWSNSINVAQESGRERMGLGIALGWLLSLRMFLQPRLRRDPDRRTHGVVDAAVACLPLLLALALLTSAVVVPMMQAPDVFAPKHCSGLGFAPSSSSPSFFVSASSSSFSPMDSSSSSNNDQPHAASQDLTPEQRAKEAQVLQEIADLRKWMKDTPEGQKYAKRPITLPVEPREPRHREEM
ncbi:hypothetical protein RI367_004661 [Sorochytrium milnesiophthora]